MTFRIIQGPIRNLSAFTEGGFGWTYLMRTEALVSTLLYTTIILELLLALFSMEPIKRRWKRNVLGAVLQAYLALKRLLLMRTSMVDQAEGKLLQLLEELTTGAVILQLRASFC